MNNRKRRDYGTSVSSAAALFKRRYVTPGPVVMDILEQELMLRTGEGYLR